MSDQSISNIQLSKLTFIIYSFSSYLSDIDQGSVVFSYIVMALVPFCINGNKYSYNLLWLCMIILSYPFISQTIPIFFIYFFVYVFRNYSLTKFASFTFSLYACFFFLQLVLLKLGIVHNDTNDLLKGVTNSFGFRNPNSFASFLMGINIFILMMSNAKHFWKGIVTIFFINQWMLSETSSRTPWIATIIMLVVAISYKFNLISNWTRYIFSLLPFLFTFLCYYFVRNANKYPELDIILSGRLDLLNGMLCKLSTLQWFTGFMPDDALDCAYIGIVANGGILWLLFFLYSSTRTLYYKYNIIKPYLPVIILILVSGLTENSFCGYRPYSILFWMIILVSHSKKNHYESSLSLRRAGFESKRYFS